MKHALVFLSCIAVIFSATGGTTQPGSGAQNPLCASQVKQNQEPLKNKYSNISFNRGGSSSSSSSSSASGNGTKAVGITSVVNNHANPAVSNLRVSQTSRPIVAANGQRVSAQSTARVSRTGGSRTSLTNGVSDNQQVNSGVIKNPPIIRLGNRNCNENQCPCNNQNIFRGPTNPLTQPTYANQQHAYSNNVNPNLWNYNSAVNNAALYPQASYNTMSPNLYNQNSINAGYRDAILRKNVQQQAPLEYINSMIKLGMPVENFIPENVLAWLRKFIVETVEQAQKIKEENEHNEEQAVNEKQDNIAQPTPVTQQPTYPLGYPFIADAKVEPNTNDGVFTLQLTPQSAIPPSSFPSPTA